MSGERPSFLLRLCVVVGAATLLLGLVGAGMLIFRPGDDGAVAGSGLGPEVHLTGGGVHAELGVAVRWRDRGLLVTEPARRLDTPGTRWLLPPLPAQETVSVSVLVRDLRTAPPALRAQIDLVAPTPRTIEIRVPAAGAAGLDEGGPDGR